MAIETKLSIGDEAFSKPEKNRYHCKACGRTVKRDSAKAWMKSYCERTGRDGRIYLVKPPKPAPKIVTIEGRKLTRRQRDILEREVSKSLLADPEFNRQMEKALWNEMPYGTSATATQSDAPAQ